MQQLVDSSDLVERLPRGLEKAVHQHLMADEKVLVKLKSTDIGNVLICTDWRVLIIKAGFMVSGKGMFQSPYTAITGATVERGWLAGRFELTTPGLRPVSNSVWEMKRQRDLYTLPYCIRIIQRGDYPKFEAAASYIMRRVSRSKSDQ